MAVFTVSGNNSYTNAEVIPAGVFNFSLYGTWTGTLWVQRSFDNSNWLDIESFTVNGEYFGTEVEGAFYRCGFKAGGYYSGTASVRLSKGKLNLQYIWSP